MKRDSQLWLLSFYRESEIQGSLFFGRLAQRMPTGQMQCDMTRHYADEAQHARWWTECLEELGHRPLRLGESYQDRYLAAAGIPANPMEILALTHVFEHRVVQQYQEHRRLPDIPRAVDETFTRILRDEAWHLQWVRRALHEMKDEYGPAAVAEALRHFQRADDEVFAQWQCEAAERREEVLS